MTRKDALQLTISIIEKSEIANKQEIIEALQLCISELPFAHWSEAAIFDACDQFCKDHQRTYLTSADFIHPELPSHPTIKNRFGVTVKEFRDQYYPMPNTRTGHSIYTKKTTEEYTSDFVNQYRTTKPRDGAEYNRNRPNGYPTWNTIAKMNDVTAWKPLLTKLKLNEPVKFKVHSNSQSGIVEYIKAQLSPEQNT